MDTDLFFPDARQLGKKENAIQQYISENLPCKRCSVKKECINFADDNEEEYGVWGGIYRSPYING